MVVNSLSFLLFFIVVFSVYYAPGMRQSAARQNVWLLLTSYFFYGFVDWKMLPILFGITVVFYWLGAQIKKEMDVNNRKTASRYMKLGVVIGIALLLYFKYLNFFAESVAELLRMMGFNVSWSTLNIILPVGVSFFTFKLISYVIEIKRKKTAPAESLLEFATYISFFPTIMSGPIDRPNTFLPQLRKSHMFDYNLAMDGCQQILWGVFTKMVIANNISDITSRAWENYSIYDGCFLLYAALLSPVQIYAEFDGYSNMAIGVGKVLGLKITRYFDHPLLARNVAEYWNRWHISLTTWITDYVFTPLSLKLRDYAKMGIMLAITVNLVIIGLWHGANWTYAVFGIYHSLLFIPLIWSGSFGKHKKMKDGRWGMPQMKDLCLMIVTYLLISLGHIIFFAKDFESFIGYYSVLFNSSWHLQNPVAVVGARPLMVFPVLIILEWLTRKKEYATKCSDNDYKEKTRSLFFRSFLIALFIAIFGSGEHHVFAYFQF